MNSQFSSPTSTMRLDGPSEWPTPPYAMRDPWGADDGPTQVRIETVRGFDVEGQMLAFDTQRASLVFRFNADGMALRVQFHRLRKLSLLAPLADDSAGRETKMKFAGQIRKYKVALTGHEKLSGRSAGHVENRHGLFLFEPDEDEATLYRCFVPASAYTRCVMGPSVEEDARLRWAGTPAQLLAAIHTPPSQRRSKAVGEAIFDLGVLSARQLSLALEVQAKMEKKVQLGELLVGQGLLSRADLRTALGHKMGYPLVDLSQFEPQATAFGILPMELAYEHHALPLIVEGSQVIVAVDNLARVAQLAGLPEMDGMKIMPVLARQTHIEMALLHAHESVGQTVLMAPEIGWKLTAPMAV
jgi:hypothetical protein